ncbi:MAG: MBL fold metallo-hydrolase [Myxococcota bacterium]|nr:MBL fold metallo-hydrolase [Myxococcota bacterium]
MLFRQLIDSTTSTFTYVLADSQTREAVLIDPVREQHHRDMQIIEELQLKLRFILETHIHADHITGAHELAQETSALCAVAACSGAQGADQWLEEGDTICFGQHHLEARCTPGHTAGCLTYVLDNQRMAFTGDTLMVRGCGRTDFQEGSAAQLYDSVHKKIFPLPDDCLIYPAHDYQGRTASTVGEEKKHNPRLAEHIDADAFIQIMEGLDLKYPAKIDVALPINMRCGKPNNESV